MIHVLTQDNHVRSQLSMLLLDLGFSPKFTDQPDTFKYSVTADSSAQNILIDVRIDLADTFLKSLKSANSGLNIIGFDVFDHSEKLIRKGHDETYDNCIVIPEHAQRAKTRLRNALRRKSTSSITRKTTASRPPFSFKRPSSLAQKITSKSAPLKSKQPNNPATRYLTAHSTACKRFAAQLQNATQEPVSILVGTDGCEFELAARELNFTLNQDRNGLLIPAAEELTIEFLERIERDATRHKSPLTCYLGRTDDWDSETVVALELFSEYLANLRNPHLKLIFSHATDTAEFLRHDVAESIHGLLKRWPQYSLPIMRDRGEDIPVICQQTLANLRSAHPFLFVCSITPEAIDYLAAQREQLSYTQLVRILRNAIALSQRNSLSVEDLKNYGESDTTTQHLLESMADENFFPNQNAAIS